MRGTKQAASRARGVVCFGEERIGDISSFQQILILCPSVLAVFLRSSPMDEVFSNADKEVFIPLSLSQQQFVLIFFLFSFFSVN